MSVPIALFLFKRKDTVLEIINVIRKYHPDKLYLISDQGRNDEERKIVKEVRAAVESAIDWECDIVKNYATKNRGVYENIALGALEVFKIEEKAIFLEDDNLPDFSFFRYCEELLEMYENNDKILWICGTNYFSSIRGENNEKYYFTQHLLPCGWASWAKKFTKFYDKDLKLLDDESAMKCFKESYKNKILYKQQLKYILNEKENLKKYEKYNSWDYHMLLSIRAQNLYGIMPYCNLIKNIGVDDNSIHGGNSMNNVMTARFCEVETGTMTFPLEQYQNIEINDTVEKRIGQIIQYPFNLRMRILIVNIMKKILGIDEDESLKEYFKKKNCNL